MNHIEIDWSNYESPVELIVREQNMQLEENCMKVIESYGINVNVDELVKALQFDRNQYETGYKAGYKAAQGEQRLGTWIVHGIYARCSECEETGGTILNGDKPEPFLTKFCPNCGAKMRKVAVRLEVKE